MERRGASVHSVSVHLRVRDRSSQQTGTAVELTAEWIDWLPGEEGSKSVWLDLLDDGAPAPAQPLQIVLESRDAEIEGGALDVAVVENDALESDGPTGGEFGILGSPSRDQQNSPLSSSLSGFALRARARGQRVLAYDIACSSLATDCVDTAFVQLFAADSPLGAPVEVNPSRSGDESEVQATFVGEGTIAAVWREVKGSGIQSILGRLFREDGSPLTPVLVIDQGGDQLDNPTIAGDGTGALTVSWRRGEELLTERFRDNGSVRRRVATSSELVRPLTRSTGLGESVVIWQQRGGVAAATATAPVGSLRTGSAGNQTSIVARRFDPSGEPMGDPFVLVDTESPHFDATVNEAGDIVVVYREPGTGRIRGRGLARMGSPSPVYDVTEDPGERQRPRVAVNAGGNVVVSWDEELADGTEVRARLFNRRSEALTGVATIADRVEGLLDPEDAAVAVSDTQDVAFVYRRGPSLNGRTVPAPGSSGPCVFDGTNLCLEGGRFDARVTWAAADGAGGPAGAVALTADTGYYWYFDPGNVEVVAKVLDGCAVNGHFWVFAGGLTDLQTQLLVTDTTTGEAKRYLKPDFSRYAPVRDLEAFVCGPDEEGSAAVVAAGGVSSQRHDAPAPPPGRVLAAGTAPRARPGAERRAERGAAEEAHARAAVGGAVACRTREDVLCLAGRYKVSVEFTAGAAGGSASGRVLGEDSGLFWFFDPDNIEVFAKVLDACAINGHYWVFAAGLTDVEANLRVTDSITGDTAFFRSPVGELFEPVIELTRFPCS
ncbi:MAG TPA: hypothetical protein VMT85_17485 [Thermoanaerobaculia bacterium]|nr:hypothetical protein [Thermoanaerobaculia bacterium]